MSASMLALQNATGTVIFDVQDDGTITLKTTGGTTILTVSSAGLLTATGNVVGANTGTLRQTVVAGGAAGNFTVTGITTSDVLVSVLYFAGAGTDVTDLSNLTSEFTITATNTINNAGGTASTGGKLIVTYQDVA